MKLKVDVRGERCSGTNYVYNLLKRNLKSVDFTKNFGWKHSFLDVRTPEIYNQSQYLIFIVFRNPYDWVNSLYKNPHHIHPKLRDSSFSKFIRHPWINLVEGFDEYKDVPVLTELLIERHPVNLERIRNVFHLRKFKAINHLGYTHIFDNVVYVNLEKVQKNWKQFVLDIDQKYFQEDVKEPVNEILYKGVGNYGTYNPQSYRMSDEDFEFMIGELDWNVESRVGYTLEEIKAIHASSV